MTPPKSHWNLLNLRIDVVDPEHELGRGTQREKWEKRFECSFLLSHIVLWSFKGIFVRANNI